MLTLTASSLRAARTCLQKYWLRYVIGLVKDREDPPLRIGKSYHLGQEVYSDAQDSGQAIDAAAGAYEILPSWADATDWSVECETVRMLLAGYFWYYADDLDSGYNQVASEYVWRMPLVNPATGKKSRTWKLAGRMDGIIELPSGEKALREHKTTVEDIDPNSKYWRRLQADLQIGLYVLAARYLGWDVGKVLYDVARKPGISPKLVTNLDDQGRPIVLDAEGQRVLLQRGPNKGQPRTSGDKDKGYELQQHRETPDEYATRLLEDIGQNPTRYYQRRQIVRLDAELELLQYELWNQAKILHQCRQEDRWYRNVGRWTCDNCEYEPFCLEGRTITPDGLPPEGFKKLGNVHPELDLEPEPERSPNNEPTKKTPDTPETAGEGTAQAAPEPTVS